MNYEKEQERIRNMLESVPDVGSSEVGDDISDISDVEDERETINNPGEESASDESFDEELVEGNMSTNQTVPPITVANLINPIYFGNDGPNPTVWSDRPQRRPSRTRRHNLVTQLPGPVRQAKHAKTELECWSLFFPEETIEKIVFYTNQKLNEVKANFARDRDAKDTDSIEIKALIGLLYLAGVLHSHHQNVLDLWSNDGLGVEIFRLTMSVSRFRILLRNLRFDDIHDREQRKSQDRFYCMREFFVEFVRLCQENYSHGEFVTIDEMLPNFRGKCSFRVYMPQKPGKFGIKVWAMTDSKTFYTSNMEVFISKQHPGPYALDNSARAIVNRLTTKIHNTGRNITCDNFFTSLPLARDLLEKRLTLVGTIRKNKREIPAQLKTEPAGGSRKVNSSMFAFTNQETLVSYVPRKKKFVLLLSTLHETDEIDETTGDDCKPAIITFYNQYKCGVDVCDAMQKQYSVSRISNRWPLTVFFFSLNVGGINAFVINKANNINVQNEALLPRRKFLMNLGRQLTLQHAERRSSEVSNISKPMKIRIREVFNLPQIQPQVHEGADQGQYPYCVICPRRKNRKTTVKCSLCQVPICKEHTSPRCARCAGDDGMDTD